MSITFKTLCILLESWPMLPVWVLSIFRSLQTVVNLLTNQTNFNLILSLQNSQWNLPFFCLLLNCWNVPMTTDLIYPKGHFQWGYSFVDSGALLNKKGFIVEHQLDSFWFFPSYIWITYLWLHNKLPKKETPYNF